MWARTRAEELSFEICTVLEYEAALSGSSVSMFRDNLSIPFARVKKSLEDGTDSLHRNVSTELPLNAA